jgi:D-arabinose 1-dehydrogenase-like Zn-dependent alcohol dehydrogenase
MRAAVITRLNQPWEFQDLPDPHPQEGQVVIRIEASGLCGTDVHVHRGHFPSPLPIVAGHEPVGTIVEVGPGVTALRVGDRVGVSWRQKGCGRCHACQAQRIYCPNVQTWMNLGGGNSELMLAWAEGCTLLPDNLGFIEAAPIFCAGYTVLSGLRDGDPKPGERVAVLGLGGLGHLAVQYAKALGLETVALTGSDHKRDEARALGADLVVVAGQHAGRSLAAAGGADVIVSTTNSAAHVSQAFSALRPGGRLVNLGALDGPIQVDPTVLMFPDKRLIGSTQGPRSHLVEALALAAAGKVKPMIEQYPIDQVNEVRDRLAAGQVRYRAVFTHRRP